MSMRALASSLSLMLVVACSSGAREPEPPPPVAPPPPPTAPAPAPSIDEGEARALIDAWARAQNEGDFDAYATLYATRFEGSKRSGPRLRTYAREGWLEDRRRMFTRPMRVEISELRLATSATTVIATFVQRWSAATYEDVGTKSMLLVREGDALRIAREEMLDSSIVSEADVGASDPLALAPVIDAGGPFVVLATRVDPAWSEGEPRLLVDTPPMVAARSIVEERVPDALRRLRGRALQLHGATGPTCTATIGALHEVRRVHPHFGSVQHWNGFETGVAQPRDVIARELWPMGEGGALLVGALTTSGDCRGSIWARASDAPAPTILAEVATDPAHAAEALRLLRGTDVHRALQRDHDDFEDVARGVPWDEDGDATRTVRTFRDATGARAVVTIAVVVRDQCATFGGRAWAAFDVRDGALQLRTARADVAHEPLAAVDADGDGSIELVTADGVLRWTGDGYELTRAITPRDLDCGC
ncbi:nuclear transport factor 2 family protein [Sandaracinus amylolyticus]|uniref:nuclear transport factor 2 family protein n=1 Tax=Sandaracinus amylolyticus TaxID=927083 RepID=UPI001F3DA40C|nr:nuclear transport factor 2 family protein [Sandaracinus amylolyticus]UJR79823.1 Hypothetical protein I5071_18610 [Sandaracinus amylolyticus]